jgi:hypothetical protein
MRPRRTSLIGPSSSASFNSGGSYSMMPMIFHPLASGAMSRAFLLRKKMRHHHMDDDEPLHKYQVYWEHGPAPGLTYYTGSLCVVAHDVESAGHAAKQILKRDACFVPSCITIRKTERIL